MIKIAFFILLITYNIFAQTFSFGLNYSGVLIGKNYKSSSVYTIESECGILNDYLRIGITAAIIDARLNKSFIQNSPQVNPYELSYKVGAQIKYYPLMNKKDSNSLRPYVGIELGDYISSYVSTCLNMCGDCEHHYRINLPNTFYSNINFGSDIFLGETLGINLSCKYQIFNPTINYEKPNCNENYVESYSKYSEKINLNILLWNVGFRINF